MFAEQIQTSEDSEDWSLAACRQQPGMTDLFFSELIPDINRAKAICAGCALLEPCLRRRDRPSRAHRGVGRAAVRQRPHPPAEAQTGPPTQGQTTRARGGPAARDRPAAGRARRDRGPDRLTSSPRPSRAGRAGADGTGSLPFGAYRLRASARPPRQATPRRVRLPARGALQPSRRGQPVGRGARPSARRTGSSRSAPRRSAGSPRRARPPSSSPTARCAPPPATTCRRPTALGAEAVVAIAPGARRAPTPS